MKIDRILLVRGSEMDFYSLEYFKHNALPTDGIKYGYGKDLTAFDKTHIVDPTDADYLMHVVIDLSAYAKDHPAFTWVELDEHSNVLPIVLNDADDYIIEKPLVPPSTVWVSELEKVHDTDYTDFWLGFYNGKTPRIVNPSTNENVFVTPTTITYPNFRGEVTINLTPAPVDTDPISKLTTDGEPYYKFDITTAEFCQEITYGEILNYFDIVSEDADTRTYSVKDEVQVYKYNEDKESVAFGFKDFVVRLDYTLPFVNGFACYPEIVDNSGIKAANSTRYMQAVGDRNRGYALMDFEPVGGCTFWKLDNEEKVVGNTREFILPKDLVNNFDKTAQTILLVIDGRLMMLDDYEIMDGHVFVKHSESDVYAELDRKVCCGAHIASNSRMVTTDGSRNRLRDSNSFAIVVNSPNLQVIEHLPWFGTGETLSPTGHNTLAALDKNQFDRNARGLLYNRVTRSVTSYALEEHTATFYAENTQKEIEYRTATVTVIPEKPLVVLAGSRDNLMSAKAVLFDNQNNVVHDDQVMWPKWAIIDFIFRG